MLKGIGVDIVKIQRIDDLLKNKGEKFLSRIFTTYEIENGDKNPSFFAKRFAAKEAFAKALGCGIGSNISFTDIEVRNNSNGTPYIVCHNDNYKHYSSMLSLSDEDEYAVAMVVIYDTVNKVIT
jgi:holo-[acyl-carrier protein] synthase